MTGDGYVPVRLAAEAYRRPVQTIYRWIREDVVSHRREGDQVLVFFRDVMEAAETRQRRVACVADVA